MLHWLPFAAGIFILALAAFSPLAAMSQGFLLLSATLQHVLLSDVAPVLIVLGLRPPLTEFALRRAQPLDGRRKKIIAALMAPAVIVPLWIAFTWLWAVPPITDFAARHEPIAWIAHITLLASGLGLWWLIVDPLPGAQARPNGQRMALIGATHIASACVCLPMMWLSHSQYRVFAIHADAYGMSAANDQHIAGGLMTVIEFIVFAIAFAAVFISILNRSDANDAVNAEWLASD